MAMIRLGEVESRFADIIWNNEPLHSRKLVKLCEEALDWKRSTTYTVLRKLIDRGLFKNEDGVVSSVISRQEYDAMQSTLFVEESFDGSLPAFIAAFTRRKALSPEEVSQIQEMIEEAAEEA